MGAEPLEQQAQRARPDGGSMLGKGVKAPGLPSLVGSRCGGHYLGLSPECKVPGGGLAPWVTYHSQGQSW
jgi:hypothetical protein